MRNKIAAILRSLRKQHGCGCVKPLIRVVENEYGVKEVRLPFCNTIQHSEDKKYLLWNDHTGSTKAVEIT